MRRIFPRRREKILREAGVDVDPGEEAECEEARAARGAGAGCDQCPGQCSQEGVECHEVSSSLAIGPDLKYRLLIGVCSV